MPRRNQLTSPPAEKARPSPVTISARIGARSASHGGDHRELADHLRAHRVHGVGPRSASACRSGPSVSNRIVFSSGGVGDVSGSLMLTPRGRRALVRRECMAAAVPTVLRPWQAATTSAGSNAARTSPSSASGCPTSPASTCSATATAGSSTSASRARSASGSPATSPARSTLGSLADADRVDRLPRHRDRGRGADRRAAVHQAPPADPQRQAPRRQVLPVHRDQPRRGVPARLLHPRAAPPEPRLLRPLRERAPRPRDARAARQAVPVPDLRRRRARSPLRRPLPRLLHQALRGALRRLRRRRGVRPQHRRDPPLPLRPLPRRRARPDREDGGRRGRPGVRAGGAVPRPASPRSAR